MQNRGNRIEGGVERLELWMSVFHKEGAVVPAYVCATHIQFGAECDAGVTKGFDFLVEVLKAGAWADGDGASCGVAADFTAVGAELGYPGGGSAA